MYANLLEIYDKEVGEGVNMIDGTSSIIIVHSLHCQVQGYKGIPSAIQLEP